MGKNKSSDDEIHPGEIPPIGGIFVLVFSSGIIFTMNLGGDIFLAKATLGAATFLGITYFGLRFKQIYQEQGLTKAIRWTITAPADRNKNQFHSPDLGSMMPDNRSGHLKTPNADSLIPDTSKSGEKTLKELRSMNEYDFENLVGDVWEERGWDTTVTRGSNDQGIDIVAEKEAPYHKKHLIQAKRYSKGNKVGSKEVQQYYSLKDQENNVDEVIIITTSSFTSQAKELAGKLNVKLIDGEEFLRIYQEKMGDAEVSN